MIFVPDEMWHREKVLRECATKLRGQYATKAVYAKKSKVRSYVAEIKDQELWLEIAAEILGRIVNPREYLASCLSVNEHRRLPLPSKVLTNEGNEKYNKWLRSQVELEPEYVNGVEVDKATMVLWEFVHRIEDIRLDTQEILSDWGMRFLEPPPNSFTDKHFMSFLHRIREDDCDNSFEEFVYASRMNFAELACDSAMFCKAVMRFYPYRDIYKQIKGLAKFWDEFEPIAKKYYLELTDFGNLDFERIAKSMSA